MGSNGSAGDAQIFNGSELKEMIEESSIGFPAAEPLPGDDRDMPFYISADDAFALKPCLMKPHSHRRLTDPERICNYRLSRARRIVENAFGILANRFQVLLTTIRQQPDKVTTVVLACVCLHSLIRLRAPAAALPNERNQEDAGHNVIPGSWRENTDLLADERRVGGNRDTRAARLQREYLTAYYSSPLRAVPWQQDMI